MWIIKWKRELLDVYYKGTSHFNYIITCLEQNYFLSDGYPFLRVKWKVPFFQARETYCIPEQIIFNWME